MGLERKKLSVRELKFHEIKGLNLMVGKKKFVYVDQCQMFSRHQLDEYQAIKSIPINI